ncbi:MAG: cupin domain-containing protein [Aquabacterium sp.]|nr:cupin domain-containing protein [Aquabacterium sp.]
MIVSNLFASIPSHLPAELSQTLVSSNNIRIERIVSAGHVSADGHWYDQSENEWVIVLKGEAKLETETGSHHLNSGDYVNIPAHTKHRVAWTTPTEETIWLAIFY